MNSALTVANVSKAFGATQALRDVSLDVAEGTIHALVGGNGSGKSTLIKILAGVQHADGHGRIRVGDAEVPAHQITPGWAAAAGLRFVHQDIGAFPNLPVAENLAIGRGYETDRAGRIRWRKVSAHAEAVLERFEISVQPRQLMAELAPADRTLVAIARALQDQQAAPARVLILDEPTSCLPATEVDRLLASLRRYAAAGQAIVFVSHRLGEIVQIADAASVLRDGAHTATIRRHELSEQLLVELIAGGSPETDPGRPRLGRKALAAGQPALAVRRLASGRLHDISFDLWPGEIVGVAGLLGSGRSRLLRSLFGVVPMQRGEIAIGGQNVRQHGIDRAIEAGIAFVPEDRAADAAFPEMTIRENLSGGRLARYWRGLRLHHSAEARDAADSIRRYRIRASSDGQPLASLSGGNQQKVILARWLRTEPRVLLLDEPTQGVDVHARTEIHTLLRRSVEAGSAALIVSSDFEELSAIADRVLVLRDGLIVAEVEHPHVTPSHLTQLAFRPQEHAA